MKNYKDLSSRAVRVLVMLILLITNLSLLITNVQAAFDNYGWGVRPMGMGGAFSSVADDANAPLFNPAGIAQLEKKEAAFNSSKLFTGLEGVDIGLNYFSVIYPVNETVGSFGLTWSNLYAPALYREDTVNLAYGRQIVRTSGFQLLAGANLKYLRHEYTLDERTINDAVFKNATAAGNMTFDLGVMTNFENAGLSFALVSKNITNPDLGLQSADRVDNENVFGASYYNEVLPFVKLPCFTLATDVVNTNKDFDYRIGAETVVLDKRLGIRLGGSPEELTTGFGYRINLKSGADITFDYALALPLQVQNTSGSHRIGVVLRLP
jgi:hypothetical protein